MEPEPSDELQMNFARPIPFCNNANNHYLLTKVDRFNRFPTAQNFRAVAL